MSVFSANTPDGSPTRAHTTAQNGEATTMPTAPKIPATPPATAASSSISVVAAPMVPQQPQTCIQYPVYVQPQAPPTPVGSLDAISICALMKISHYSDNSIHDAFAWFTAKRLQLATVDVGSVCAILLQR